jgi:hypothetical protein
MTITSTIKLLNDALEADPVGINALFSHHVKVNGRLASHPTIQVSDKEGLGVLGLLNGVFGCNSKGWGYITAVVEDDGKISRFERTK